MNGKALSSSNSIARRFFPPASVGIAANFLDWMNPLYYFIKPLTGQFPFSPGGGCPLLSVRKGAEGKRRFSASAFR